MARSVAAPLLAEARADELIEVEPAAEDNSLEVSVLVAELMREVAFVFAGTSPGFLSRSAAKVDVLPDRVGIVATKLKSAVLVFTTVLEAALETALETTLETVAASEAG